MRTLYCIPGLGADERLFDNLALESFEIKPLRWLSPMPGESISRYARRLADQIDTTRPYYLLGVSFGGMIAIELARILQPQQLIIVSSIRHYGEFPWYARLIGKLRVHKLLPFSVARFLAPLGSYLMGARSDADRDLLRKLARETDASFFKWSVDQILRWQGGISSENLIHIHGTADRILPFKYVRPDSSIKGGTHFMIFNRAVEISTLLEELIADKC